MIVMSTPCSSKDMAVVCLKVWAVTDLCCNDGHVTVAFAMYKEMRCSTASRPRRLPVLVGTGGPLGHLLASASHARSTETVPANNGVRRSFRPLPTQWT